MVRVDDAGDEIMPVLEVAPAGGAWREQRPRTRRNAGLEAALAARETLD